MPTCGPTGPVAPPVTDAGTPLDVPRDVATDVRPDIVDVVTDAPDTGTRSAMTSRCVRTGVMDRWECAAFAEWLHKTVI